MNRSNAIYLIAGIIIGLLLMVLFRSFEPEPDRTGPSHSILVRSLQQRDQEILVLKSDNQKLSILASKENDTVEIIKKIYVPIYKEIDRANRDDLDRAFDSLLTE